MENKEKKEKQCIALIEMCKILGTDDVERVVDITTGFTLARSNDLTKLSSSEQKGDDQNKSGNNFRRI